MPAKREDTAAGNAREALTDLGLEGQSPGAGYMVGRGRPGRLCQPSIWIGFASGGSYLTTL
jgi:hypothetical protein